MLNQLKKFTGSMIFKLRYFFYDFIRPDKYCKSRMIGDFQFFSFTFWSKLIYLNFAYVKSSKEIKHLTFNVIT